jgi:hypothetical protein
MNTKKITPFTLMCTIVLIVSCTKQPYYNVPTGPNGTVVITGVASTTSTGITSLDDKFTVNATFPNAKPGDVMKAELLKLQIPSSGGAAQLFPLAGTQKDVTVGTDLKATVTFTRAEAKMNVLGDYVTVTFSGKTDAGIIRVDMKTATSVVGPQYGSKTVDVMRSPDTAFFDISVQPKLAPYAGLVTVKRKNGVNAPWLNVGTGGFVTGSKVPISGNDFASGKDTMIYSFVAQQGTYTDSFTTSVVVSDPSFFLKKAGTLSLANAAQSGMNILTNSSVTATNASAIISVSGSSLIIKEGAAWSVGGKSISFVPSTADIYNKNNSSDAINAFNNGIATTQIEPGQGNGIYIFKIVNGPLATDVVYGMMKISKIVPATSVEYEYRIGNAYNHLSIIK